MANKINIFENNKIIDRLKEKYNLIILKSNKLVFIMMYLANIYINYLYLSQCQLS